MFCCPSGVWATCQGRFHVGIFGNLLLPTRNICSFDFYVLRLWVLCPYCTTAVLLFLFFNRGRCRASFANKLFHNTHS